MGLFVLIQPTYQQATLTTGCAKITGHEYYYEKAHMLLTWNGNVQIELKLTVTVNLCNVPACCESLHNQLVVLSTTASVQRDFEKAQMGSCFSIFKTTGVPLPIVVVPLALLSSFHSLQYTQVLECVGDNPNVTVI